MPKFYVECGPIQTIITADCVESAALAALDRTLQSQLWVYADPQLSNIDRYEHLVLESLLNLEPSIRVSEMGFGRKDAQIVGTPETVCSWHKLMVGMQRLFVSAGLFDSASEMASEHFTHRLPSRRPR